MRKAENKIIRRRMASAWISMLISITLVLMLVGVATLLMVNARSISDYFRENMAVSVVLKTEVSDADASAFEKALAGKPFVKGTRLISREQGTAEMAALLGDDFLTAFSETPVPVSIDLTLKPEYVSKDSLAKIESIVGEEPLVDEVVYQSSLVEALNENLNKVTLVLAVLTALLLFIAAIVGVGLVALVMYLFKWLGSMQQSGNINVYKSAVGCQGKVYLTIPAARSGEGKVQITINNSVREYNAVTDGDEIKNGTAIKVTEVLNDSTLLVEELNSLII